MAGGTDTALGFGFGAEGEEGVSDGMELVVAGSDDGNAGAATGLNDPVYSPALVSRGASTFAALVEGSISPLGASTALREALDEEAARLEEMRDDRRELLMVASAVWHLLEVVVLSRETYALAELLPWIQRHYPRLELDADDRRRAEVARKGAHPSTFGPSSMPSSCKEAWWKQLGT